MDATFLGILDKNLQAIKDANSYKDQNEKLLTTVNLLLIKLNNSFNEHLSNYKKENNDDMLELFSDLSKIAQSVCDFYQTSKKISDPVALNEEIGNDLEKTTNELNDKIALIMKIDKDNAELLKKENELDKKEGIYRKKKEKIASLREKEEKYTEEAIKNLILKYKKLEEEIKKNKLRRTELENTIKEGKKASDELSNAIAHINIEKKEIEENIVATINKRRNTIEEFFVSESKSLNKIIDEIEKYKKQFIELDELRKKNSRHLEENKNIINKMDEYGILLIDNFISDNYNLEKTIRDRLGELDSKIKPFIEAQERDRDNIRKLQSN